MSEKNRADFLPKPTDPDREPHSPDFDDPEIANWGETDPQLAEDVKKAFTESFKRNIKNPKLQDKIIRIAATIGLIITAYGAGKYLYENTNKEPDFKPTESSVPISPEAQQAIDGIQKIDAAEYFQNAKNIQSAQEKDIVKEALKPQDVPQTVIDQNFDGLDTTKIE